MAETEKQKDIYILGIESRCLITGALNSQTNTMQKALSELERSGLVMAQRTSGRVVTEDMDMIGEVRNNLAREQVHEFFVRMQELGYNRQEIMHLLEKEGEHE